MDITVKQSDSFWAIKALAIFSVFFAHMPGHGLNAEIYARIGLVGVPLFMICAGFFDNSKKRKLSVWFNKKLKTIIIPWLIWGTITFIIHILKTHEIGIIHYLKWILGIGTWLYFVPVLLCCQFLSRYVNIIVLLALGVVTMLLSVFHLVPYNDVFTPYVNPFNFIGYFAVGRLLHSNRKWMSIKLFYWGGVSFLICIATIYFIKPVYWYPYSLAISLLLFISLFSVFHSFESAALNYVGKISFVIYLSHIQVAGMVNSLLNTLWGTPIEFVKVIVAFVVVVVMILGIQYVLTIKKMNKIGAYLGFR